MSGRRPAVLVVFVCLVVTCACSSPNSPTPTTTTTTSTTSTIPASTTTTSIPPPLTITCSPNITTTSFTGAAVSVTFPTPPTSGGIAPIQVSCDKVSGSPFPIGTTPVQCTATDAARTVRSCTFTITVTAQVSPRLSRTKFLAFGDSLTAGEITVPTTATREGEPNYRLVVVPSSSYPAQLLTLLRGHYLNQSSTIDVVNAGLSSEWAEDGAVRLPGVLNTQRPEAVLLLQGLNDLAAQGSLGITRGARAIDTMAQEISGRGMRLFIATLPPPRPGALRSVDSQLILSLNSRIRLTASAQRAVLVDIYPEILADVNRYIGVDGLHMTEAGYSKLAELFFNAIRTDLEVR